LAGVCACWVNDNSPDALPPEKHRGFTSALNLEEDFMRPISGAIIVAGAALGLGLTAIGFGTRYRTSLENLDKDGNPILLHLYQMDKPLVFIMVFLTSLAIIGLGITFVGLSYHHHRRLHEMHHRENGRHSSPERATA
jgi:hypothetical protein